MLTLPIKKYPIDTQHFNSLQLKTLVYFTSKNIIIMSCIVLEGT